LSEAATSPSRRAGELVASIYDRVYNLALRMLLLPEDAEDATQDIVVKILRGLPGFRGESSFDTWDLAIASNHLLSLKSRNIPSLSFEAYEAEVGAYADDRGIIEQGTVLTEGERRLLEEELKVSCTLGMLQCLDPTDRLVYILYSFFALSSEAGGIVAGLSPEAYRQRLSRAPRLRARARQGIARGALREGGISSRPRRGGHRIHGVPLCGRRGIPLAAADASGGHRREHPSDHRIGGWRNSLAMMS
jgi:RNA polymerase sigma factor (sigma-70 family)